MKKEKKGLGFPSSHLWTFASLADSVVFNFAVSWANLSYQSQEDSISRSQHMTAWESQATKTKIISKWGMPKPGDRWTRQQASPENFKIRELFTAKRNRRGTVTYMGKMELREVGDQPWWNSCQKYPELWKCQPSFTCPHLHFQWQAWLHNLTQSKCHPEHFLSWI